MSNNQNALVEVIDRFDQKEVRHKKDDANEFERWQRRNCVYAINNRDPRQEQRQDDKELRLHLINMLSGMCWFMSTPQRTINSEVVTS